MGWTAAGWLAAGRCGWFGRIASFALRQRAPGIAGAARSGGRSAASRSGRRLPRPAVDAGSSWRAGRALCGAAGPGGLLPSTRFCPRRRLSKGGAYRSDAVCWLKRPSARLGALGRFRFAPVNAGFWACKALIVGLAKVSDTDATDQARKSVGDAAATDKTLETQCWQATGVLTPSVPICSICVPSLRRSATFVAAWHRCRRLPQIKHGNQVGDGSKGQNA